MRLPDLSGIQLPREPTRLVRRSLRHVAGALLGLLLGPLLILTALLQLIRWRGPFRRVRRWELRRLHWAYRLQLEDGTGGFLGGRRALLHGGVAAVLGYVMGDLLLLVAAVVLGSMVQSLYGSAVVIEFDLWAISRPAPAVLLIFGTSSLLAAALYAEFVVWLQTRLLRRWTGVVRADAMDSRISRLLTTRRGVVVAIDDERRRIERDLHDGVQQNVVSLSVTLARARRADDPERSAELLDQAHAQSQALIEEVRQVAWRIYPTALDEHGLASALDGVAQTSPVPVHLDLRLDGELPQAAESAAYFVAREAVTNVVKHAEATRVDLALATTEEAGRTLLRLTVTDDGIGGADPEGGGLQGLARRVAALDGSVSVDSPLGGPTTITAEIPCD
ncbi:sensor histidine kinase [Brachybacterium sacelli]|uniref:histidine kinase n=1 Tax=Brachybacterium sacelli TaxID=173364 RepID=A0ABS4X7D4_9MICO|nr:histidine kinase [Brachybacterium sacelli]MBP2384221.1 signal transduction histidine kinase [Brachybacterium sacelli]